ncbi:alpha/beta fold hydrolase [Cellulomonas fimi]|uniref:Alpha/beta hydrolase fold protein n=1 Tax=Cellulomonas fimi (strain ATCC 484 / DSM 20113 / JCM 1341 / CCUG 24087 / LMG 16345 / NBRC 15513 / NCIMB 8980 / NCTC 7547 / NRS-133) TaxID=590998 RepID=F4H7E2_CELFA|nr:alpha/beta fold hydrolase [Cellulomonas fimi]AEE46903.1 alpha/beta hydrolase fold protein [Cellulomonas fimi ATCC 484]NNH07850.1 alpha/beta fold hydrolase [Cellulomonas fimi]VEH34516.1 Pimelyl-[acyl-carrier protein] methyl ester esterase [Cellulomonas fimi]
MTLHTYRSGDDGLPLVLLHGFPLDHRMWDATAAAVPGTRAVLAVDLPGTPGATDALPEPSLEASADLVAAELRAAGVERAVVAGLSMGGYVALALAERHPHLVAGLALVDTKSAADTDEARANRLRIADAAQDGATVEPVRPMASAVLGETTRAARPELVDVVSGWIDDQPPVGVAWSQRAMAARPDRTDVLQAFPGPVQVVVGDEDTITPVEAAEHLVETARDAQLVVVARAGHLSALEAPDAVAAALADLAQRTDTAG